MAGRFAHRHHVSLATSRGCEVAHRRDAATPYAALPSMSGSPSGTHGRTRALSRAEGVRYAIVGLVNTVFGYGVFAVLELVVGSRLPYLAVLLVAHVVGVLNAFLLHRVVTFRVRGQLLLDLARFWSIHLVGLAINLVLLPVLVEVAGLPVLIAQAAVLLLVAIGSYAGHKRFSFRRSTEAAVASGHD